MIQCLFFSRVYKIRSSLHAVWCSDGEQERAFGCLSYENCSLDRRLSCHVSPVGASGCRRGCCTRVHRRTLHPTPPQHPPDPTRACNSGQMLDDITRDVDVSCFYLRDRHIQLCNRNNSKWFVYTHTQRHIFSSEGLHGLNCGYEVCHKCLSTTLKRNILSSSMESTPKFLLFIFV